LVSGYLSLYIELPITQSIIESKVISPPIVVYSGQVFTSVCSILIVLVSAIKVLSKLKVITNKNSGITFITVFFIGLCLSFFYYVGFDFYLAHYAQLITVVIAGLTYQLCAKVNITS
jgi:hypothetical protein